jgi:hypothetical protein
MRKSIAVITAVVVLFVSGLALAQMNDKGKDMTGDKAGMMGAKGSMMGKGMMGGGMRGGEMMQMMQMMGMMQQIHTSMVPSSGGGVIVMSGGKLVKYDKELNIVKQVDLPKPEMGMMGNGMGMMRNKGMMKMCRQIMGNGTDSDNKASVDNTDEHAAHHPEQ